MKYHLDIVDKLKLAIIRNSNNNVIKLDYCESNVPESNNTPFLALLSKRLVNAYFIFNIFDIMWIFVFELIQKT